MTVRTRLSELEVSGLGEWCSINVADRCQWAELGSRGLWVPYLGYRIIDSGGCPTA